MLDGWELYDLEEDPQELYSLYGKPGYEKITAKLKTELTRLRNQYKVPKDTRPLIKASSKQKKKKASQHEIASIAAASSKSFIVTLPPTE